MCFKKGWARIADNRAFRFEISLGGTCAADDVNAVRKPKSRDRGSRIVARSGNGEFRTNSKQRTRHNDILVQVMIMLSSSVDQVQTELYMCCRLSVNLKAIPINRDINPNVNFSTEV